MYSIKRVSEMLGIPAVTIRAWENRYQMISPVRTEGGHRLYSDKDIRILRWLQKQVKENQLRISEAVRLLQQKGMDDADQPGSALQGPAMTNMIQELYEALIELNTTEPNRLIDLAFALYDYETVFHQMLVPVLEKIGDEWEKGAISVAQEHFSSQLVMQRFAQVSRIYPADPSLPQALAFCPEGEHHHIGLMLFTLFLRRKGFDVIYLGEDTPFEGLRECIESQHVKLLAISITGKSSVPLLEKWIAEITKDFTHLRMIIGGKGVGYLHLPDHPNIYYLEEDDWEDWYRANLQNEI